MEGNKTPSEVCFASLICKTAIERHLKGPLNSAAKMQGLTACLRHKLIAHLHFSRLS